MAQALTKAALMAGAALQGARHAALAQPLRPAAALLPRLPARHRPLTTAAAAGDPADPYWADADKPKVNVYSAYTIYKGSAAMALKVIKPTWQQIGSGLAIEREGTVLLEFARSTGPKSYAWDQKETFGLSAVECAAVLEAADKHQAANFVHDPYKGGEGEGRIIKTLRVSPAKEQGWGFNVNVKEGGADKASIYCSVSDAELRLIKTLLAFLVPRLLGFDEHFQGAPSVLEPSQGAGEAGGAPF